MPPFQIKSTLALRIQLISSVGVTLSLSIPKRILISDVSVRDLALLEYTALPGDIRVLSKSSQVDLGVSNSRCRSGNVA